MHIVGTLAMLLNEGSNLTNNDSVFPGSQTWCWVRAYPCFLGEAKCFNRELFHGEVKFSNCNRSACGLLSSDLQYRPWAGGPKLWILLLLKLNPTCSNRNTTESGPGKRKCRKLSAPIYKGECLPSSTQSPFRHLSS